MHFLSERHKPISEISPSAPDDGSHEERSALFLCMPVIELSIGGLRGKMAA